MLDVSDFIKERGGDPQKVRDSQRRRNAPESAVDEVIALYEDHRKSMLLVSSTLSLRSSCSPLASEIRSFANRDKDQHQPEGARGQEKGVVETLWNSRARHISDEP